MHDILIRGLLQIQVLRQYATVVRYCILCFKKNEPNVILVSQRSVNRSHLICHELRHWQPLNRRRSKRKEESKYVRDYTDTTDL